MVDWVETVVVGAGVVGLAIARRLAMAGQDVVVLEAADCIGSETSSRNSEVIHAGIYYAKNSLKARLCVSGKHALYAYCESHKVGHKRCGKLIVASDTDELDILSSILPRAHANGVEDVYFIDAADAVAMEPELFATGALVSPSTGIIDSHGLMLAYQGDAEDHGAMIAFSTVMQRAARHPDGFIVTAAGAGESEPFEIGARHLINATGLYAPDVAHKIEGLDPDTLPKAYYCKGSYFSLMGGQPFQRLIYPVPNTASLGVHVTVDLAGQMRFGPDQEWVDSIDYEVDPARAEAFYASVRRFWPALADGALVPGYAGIRPKIQAPHEPVTDFRIDGPAEHGIDGLVNMFGMESPGLTASLAIADHVASKLGNR